MKDNGTDRDVALLILEGLTSCANLVAAVNSNLYAAHITTQPEDASAELDQYVYLSFVATNVSAYQWQYLNPGGRVWTDTTLSGYATDTVTVKMTEARDGMQFRCKITGKDGVDIFSDEVTVTVEAGG